MMSSVSLNFATGVYSVTFSQPNASTAAVPPTATLMSDPALAGDVGTIIAKLVIENAFTSRMQARQCRQHATEAMVAAQEQQIAHMREAADARYDAAQMEAYGKIGEGMFGIAGGAAIADRNEGAGKILTSSGQIGSGMASLEAQRSRHGGDQLEADAKAAENDAAQQKRLIEAADDDIEEARDYTRAAIDFLREFESTQTKSMSSAIKG
jgi:hypothetical protein